MLSKSHSESSLHPLKFSHFQFSSFDYRLVLDFNLCELDVGCCLAGPLRIFVCEWLLIATAQNAKEKIGKKPKKKKLLNPNPIWRGTQTNRVNAFIGSVSGSKKCYPIFQIPDLKTRITDSMPTPNHIARLNINT